jgi:CRISPR/Cas system-associated endoribonuclease Cas2
MSEEQNGDRDQVYEGEMDPRVQEELERLNKSSQQINSLETSLTKARNDYRNLLQSISVELKAVEKQLGSCVKKARPYYEARSKYHVEKELALRASERFEHAVSRHGAAREMVTVAEASLSTSKNCRPDEKIAWAEMLNSATEKVNSAEKERLDAFSEHTQRLKSFQIQETQMTRLQKSLKRHILNSKQYFQLKSERMRNVDDKRTVVTSLDQNLILAKSDYAAALRTLETISEQIHLQRKLETLEISGNSNRTGNEEDGAGGASSNGLLDVPDRPNSDQTSFRSILSDMNRVDSTDHLDNISDPNDSDRLSIDSGMWTPGSGGCRNSAGRLRPRNHTMSNGGQLTSLSTGNINAASGTAVAGVAARELNRASSSPSPRSTPPPATHRTQQTRSTPSQTPTQNEAAEAQTPTNDNGMVSLDVRNL